MSKALVDVVNFNPDASCLAAAHWLDALHGGANSRLCSWLGLYVDRRRPLALGLVAGAVSDMQSKNPEAIALINANLDVFEILRRPFSHDVPLLRTPAGFVRNMEIGDTIVARAFASVANAWLAPEFMMTTEQVTLLAERGVEYTFVHPARFDEDIRSRLPRQPYMLSGALGASIGCIPVSRSATEKYLRALQTFAPFVAEEEDDVTVLWRDGESPFLLPDGVEREARWLDAEVSPRVGLREFVNEQGFAAPSANELPHYPLHPFRAWVKESRMLGFLWRMETHEARLGEMCPAQLALWLQVANSDVLSSVEKPPARFDLTPLAGGPAAAHMLHRTPRAFEGEDLLAVLERWDEPGARAHLQNSDAAHIVKARMRIKAVEDAATG